MTHSTALDLADHAASLPDASLRERARGRAIGALVMSFFGAWWAASGLLRSSCPAWAWGVLATIVAAIAVTAARTLRAHPSIEEPLPAALAERRQRAGRIFWWTCAAEVAGILIGVNVVANLGHPEWQPIAVMLAVGLHFLPLSVGFQYRPHLVTGVALTGWALAYPSLLAAGALAPAGMAVAGAILFASAAWALRSATAR